MFGLRRVELDVADAARRAGARLLANSVSAARALGRVGRAVVDERPARAAVGGLVEAPLGGARHRAGHAGAADARHAAQRGGGADVEGVRVARLDDDLADALAAELVLAERPAPRVAAVGRLVEADAGDAAGAARVRLAGADVDRVAGRVVRVDRDRPDRVDPERAREVVQCGVPARAFVGAPDRRRRPARSTCGSGPGCRSLAIARSVVRPPADVLVRDVVGRVAERRRG